jgi:hypothetical protein
MSTSALHLAVNATPNKRRSDECDNQGATFKQLTATTLPEKYAKDHYCDNCEAVATSIFCINCREQYCNECYRVLHLRRSRKTHTIMTIAQYYDTADVCSYKQQLAVIRALIRAGADMNVKIVPKHETALHHAGMLYIWPYHCISL